MSHEIHNLHVISVLETSGFENECVNFLNDYERECLQGICKRKKITYDFENTLN